MDKTLAAIYAVSGTGKSPGYQSVAHERQITIVNKQANTKKSYFDKLKKLVDRLRR